MSYSNGYLKVILGSMFSGKTTELIRIYNRYKACDISACVINHSLDKRYHSSKLSSHNKQMIESINCVKLMDVLPIEIKKSNIFIINEGQFFNDLTISVQYLLHHKKTVYVCGLDGDFKREKFGQMLDIIPLCDDVVKLKGICNRCKQDDAIFTHRTTVDNNHQILVGNNIYKALCRKCYYSMNN